MIKFFKSINFNIAMVTNLGNNLDFWNRIIDDMDILYCSFHPRYAKIDHFKKLCNIFLDRKKHVEIHVLMDPEYWDIAEKASKEFMKTDGVIVNNKGILDVNDYKKRFTPLYTEHQIKYIQENPSNEIYNTNNDKITVEYFNGEQTAFDGQKIISNNYFNFFGSKCYTGMNSLVIKQDGSVWGSQCRTRYFGNLQQDKNLRIKLFDIPAICQKNTCTCLFDMKIQKSFI
jgi:hypothetical protein